MNTEKQVEMGDFRMQELEYEEAYGYYLEAALDNNPKAIYNLGLIYLYGRGVTADYKKAFHYLTLYFDLTGEHDMLWRIMEMRNDILPNAAWEEQYREFLEYLLTNKVWDVCIIMANEYLEGKIYSKDSDKAIELYQNARQNGIAMASECLAEMYFLGAEVGQDYEMAYELLMDHEDSMSFIKPYYLGLMYKNGYHVPQNRALARERFVEIVESKLMMKECDKYYPLAQKELEDI